MHFLLFVVLGTVHYGCCGNWSVQYGERMQAVKSGCTTIRCSYTYPLEHQVKAEIWTGSPRGLYDKKEVIAYHTNEDLIDPYFKGRTTFLGNKNGDCALHVNYVTRHDRGDYRFKLETNLSVFSAEDQVYLDMDRLIFFMRGSDSCRLFITAFRNVVQEGKEGVLTCYSSRCADALQLQWYASNGEKITEGTSSEDSPGTTSLSMIPSWQDNGKVIQCRGYNREYRTGEMCMIIAKSTLHVRHTPKGIQTVLLSSLKDWSHGGDTTLLKCVVIASNPAVSNYTWYKDGSQIPNQFLQTIRIENMTITELGRFSCVAHNEVGPSLPSPSNLVGFTEGVPMTLQRCSSFPSGLFGISVAAVAAITISVAVSTWCCLKKKKKSNPAKGSELALKSSQHESGNLFYTNVENTYAALDQTQISPDYEEVKKQDRPT